MFFLSFTQYLYYASLLLMPQTTHSFFPHSNHTLKPNYVHTGFEVLKQKPENKLEGQIQNPTARGYMLMYERFAPFYIHFIFWCIILHKRLEPVPPLLPQCANAYIITHFETQTIKLTATPVHSLTQHCIFI